MPLIFEPRPGAVVDQTADLSIYPPRMLPASPPEPPGHTEYQFALYRGEDRHGFGMFGTEIVREIENRRRRLVILDLRRDWVIDSTLKLKRRLDITDNDLRFLQDLSKGLLAARALQCEPGEDIACRAMTDAELLAERWIEVPGALLTAYPGLVELAEFYSTTGAQIRAEQDTDALGQMLREFSKGGDVSSKTSCTTSSPL